MRILYLISCIVLSSITSAWPHPDDVLWTVADLGSVFDIFSWPAEVEDAIASPESGECPADGIPGTPAVSDTIESNPVGSIDDYLLDNDLFPGLKTVAGPREKAPPCGPDGTHHLLTAHSIVKVVYIAAKGMK